MIDIRDLVGTLAISIEGRLKLVSVSQISERSRLCATRQDSRLVDTSMLPECIHKAMSLKAATSTIKIDFQMAQTQTGPS